MKKLFYFLLMVAFFATSCADDQSSYSISSITDSATITGTVSFNQGYKEVSTGVYVDGYLTPAANQAILVRVGYDQYSATSSGEKVFETTTDENGQYSIEIPVVNTISVTVEVAPFSDSYSTILNQQIVTLEDALYNENNTSSAISLSSMSVENEDFVVTTSSEFTSTDLGLPIYIAGEVQAACEKLSNLGTSSEVADANYSIAAGGTMSIVNCAVSLNFTYTDPSTSDKTTIVYDVTSSATGDIAKAEYMLFSHWSYENVTASLDVDAFYVTESSSNAYVHYYIKSEDVTSSKNTKYYTQSLNGVYYPSSSTSASLDPLFATGDVFPYLTLSLWFQPVYGTSVYGVNVTGDMYELNDPCNLSQYL